MTVPLKKKAARPLARLLVPSSFRPESSASKAAPAGMAPRGSLPRLVKSSTPSTMPTPIMGRISGSSARRTSLTKVPALTRRRASPGSPGGISWNSAAPPSMKTWVPGSVGFRSSAIQRPRSLSSVSWVRAVTGTPAASIRRTLTTTGVRRSARATSGRSTSMAPSLSGAMTVISSALPRTLPKPSTASSLRVLTPGRRATPMYSQAAMFLEASWVFLPTRRSSSAAPFTLRRNDVPAVPLTRTLIDWPATVSRSFRPMKPRVLFSSWGSRVSSSMGLGAG
ncbi:hypothetical protein FQZ97_818700 [compost metagenome]